MIEINILKKKTEKYKKKILIMRVLFLYFTGLILILFICGLLSFTNKVIIGQIKRDIDKLKEKIESEKVMMENLKENYAKLEIICKKCAFYEEEFKERILWSNILQVIADALPAGMWINKISYKKDTTQKEKNTSIMIDGFIVPNIVQPSKGFSVFNENLKLKGFQIFNQIVLTEIKKEEIENNKVYNFKIEIKLKDIK